jgi:hypothetical protein
LWFTQSLCKCSVLKKTGFEIFGGSKGLQKEGEERGEKRRQEWRGVEKGIRWSDENEGKEGDFMEI